MRLFVFVITAITATNVLADDLCSALSGSVVISQDYNNTYLGKISNKYSDDSIFNEYGNYGSKYSSDSIWNEYSQVGSKYAAESPFNKYSISPPMIIKNKKIIGYLSVNKNVSGAINPIVLRSVCEDGL